MEEYKFKHSKLKIIGSILFFFCILAGNINVLITGNKDIGFSLLVFAILGGVLIMVGLLNEF